MASHWHQLLIAAQLSLRLSFMHSLLGYRPTTAWPALTLIGFLLYMNITDTALQTVITKGLAKGESQDVTAKNRSCSIVLE
jgi:hypothetical protein